MRYDNFGRITDVIHPDQTSISYSYLGDVVSVKNEDFASTNRITKLVYDTFGSPDDKLLSTVTDADNNVTTYTWNILGSLASISTKDAQTLNTLSRSFNFNNVTNFLDSETHPESGTTTYTRYPAGNIKTKTDAYGVKTYSYDGLNRLRTITYNANVNEFDYDNADNRVLVSSPGAEIVNSYDEMNRLIKSEATVKGLTYTTGYGYDGNDNLTKLTYPTNISVNYAYDLTKNWVTSATGFGSPITGLQYNAAGQPIDYSHSNGISTHIEYNNRYLTSRIKAGAIIDNGYVYDGRGNTEQIIDCFGKLTNACTETNNSGVQSSFGYDNLNRIVTAVGAFGSLTYDYDAFGNRLSLSSSRLNRTTYSYSTVNNRLLETSFRGTVTKYINNGYGSLTRITPPSSLEVPPYYFFVYDALNNIKQYKSSESQTPIAAFTYNADNLRVTKTSYSTDQIIEPPVVTVYHYDKDGRVISETDETGVRLANYIYVNGQLAVKKDSTGAYFYHNDPAGTPLAITDNSATVVWKSDYEPFGEEVVEIATRKNDRLFIGKERDEETGLYYFGARYMASGLGRFIAVDPVGPVDEKTGKVNGKMLLNPQRLNRYSYAINNPYRYVDINGKWPERIHNRIIEEAFGGGASGYKLPEDVRLIFKLASAHVDKDQSLDGSYMHAMRSPRMTAVEAQEKMNSFVQQKVGEYHEWINKDNPYKALFALGEAMHALMDKTSPSHEGFKVWNGIIPLLNSGTHAAEESYISSERMERTVSELRKFYNENK